MMWSCQGEPSTTWTPSIPTPLQRSWRRRTTCASSVGRRCQRRPPRSCLATTSSIGIVSDPGSRDSRPAQPAGWMCSGQLQLLDLLLLSLHRQYSISRWRRYAHSLRQCKPSGSREASRLHLSLLNLVKQLKQLVNRLHSRICCR